MTWETPFRNFITSTGGERRNPVRNQVGYIATRNQHKCFVTDSRSYGGIRLDTDHKLFKATFKIVLFKITKRVAKRIRNLLAKYPGV